MVNHVICPGDQKIQKFKYGDRKKMYNLGDVYILVYWSYRQCSKNTDCSFSLGCRMTYRDIAELVWRHPLTIGSRIAWWHWGPNMDRLRTQNLSGQTYKQLHSVKSVFPPPTLPPLKYWYRHRTQCKALLLSKLLWLWVHTQNLWSLPLTSIKQCATFNWGRFS